jgi:PiT family inorganic phosphate transporter
MRISRWCRHILAAIAWNLGTWYFGIPCSSSHTMIGALLGGGFAFFSIHGGIGVPIGIKPKISVSPCLTLSPSVSLGYRTHVPAQGARQEANYL